MWAPRRNDWIILLAIAVSLVASSRTSAQESSEPRQPPFSATARREPRRMDLPAYGAIAERTLPPVESDSQLSLLVGYEFSRGEFNDSDRTEISYVPLTLKYQNGPWIVGLTVPYIRINGPGDVVRGADGNLVISSEASGRTTESGVGDVLAALSYVFYPSSPALPALELTGRIKLPTADEDEGLGTGETDYTLQADVSKSFGALSSFATLGYRVLGDSSDLDLDDGFLASLGIGYRFSPRLNLGLAFDYREASTDGTDDSREIVPYTSYRCSDSVTLGTYGVVGLSDSSSDLAIGVTARVTW
jgi:hypothetical protein